MGSPKSGGVGRKFHSVDNIGPGFSCFTNIPGCGKTSLSLACIDTLDTEQKTLMVKTGTARDFLGL